MILIIKMYRIKDEICCFLLNLTMMQSTFVVDARVKVKIVDDDPL